MWCLFTFTQIGQRVGVHFHVFKVTTLVHSWWLHGKGLATHIEWSDYY